YDRQFNLVTSHVLSPFLLAGTRLLIAVYVLVALIYMLVGASSSETDIDSFFSYFTNLTYIGICAYFFASGIQTLLYALKKSKTGEEGYPLQQWPRILRYLHILLLSTVVTYPFLVTIVYWILLASSSTFATPYSAWSNISKHALNSVFAAFEIALSNIEPLPWIDLPVTIVILAGYLGVAYITHATQGIYTYSFLDPKKQGKKLAVYIIGIAIGQVVIFCIVVGILHLRKRLTKRS
ncbi:hypothetical protein M413DRAFT_47246, partial [Hebeloma cylindrosporum]